MKLSFRMKILLPVVLAVAFSFIAMGFLLYGMFYKEISTVATEGAWNLSYRYANLLRAKFDAAFNLTEALSETAKTFSGNAEGITRSDTIKYLGSTLATNADIFAVWMVWEKGSFDGNSNQNRAGSPGVTADGRFAPMVFKTATGYSNGVMTDVSAPRYQTPLQTGQAFISEPFKYSYGGQEENVITISKPFSINGRVVGVAGVDIRVSDLAAIVSDIKLYDSGYGVLLTKNLITIAHPMPDQIGKANSVSAQLKPFAARGEDYMVERMSIATGQVSFGFYVPVKLSEVDYTYYLGMNIVKAEIFASLGTVRNTVIIVAILAILLVVAVVIAVVRGLMKKLGGEPDYVVSCIQRIAAGDFTVDMHTKANDHSSLSFSVKEMTDGLKTIVASNITIADNVKIASSTLSAGVQELSAGMADQSDRSNMISSASEEMTSTTGGIAQNLAEIANFTHETSDKVVSGRGKVEKSVQEIAKIKNTVDGTAQLVNLLGEKSLEIKNIVSVISGVADQTNLLALNAAIEAARAGDAGRGFAVVADEVRKLAENTQKATHEISELVVSTQKEMQNVANSMEQVNEQVSYGVESSNQTTQVLAEIEDGISMLESMVDSISAATQEMSATSNQIQQDISSVAVISTEVKTTADHLAVSASDLERNAEVMKDMMGKFKI